MSLKFRLWSVSLVLAVVGSLVLKASPRIDPVRPANVFYTTLFSWDVTSESRMMAGTKGYVRAIYDSANSQPVGIDYCHNHPGETANTALDATLHDHCYRTTYFDEMKKGARIKLPVVGTAVAFQSENIGTSGGRIKLKLGSDMNTIGSNTYRFIEFELVKNPGSSFGALMATYSGQYFDRVELTGTASYGGGTFSNLKFIRKNNPRALLDSGKIIMNTDADRLPKVKL